jgi:hypothetical protein
MDRDVSMPLSLLNSNNMAKGSYNFNSKAAGYGLAAVFYLSLTSNCFDLWR